MPPIIAFRKTLEFEYGFVEQVSPLIRRIVASNPSAFTFHGTGTYIVGHGSVAVVDTETFLEIPCWPKIEDVLAPRSWLT